MNRLLLSLTAASLISGLSAQRQVGRVQLFEPLQHSGERATDTIGSPILYQQTTIPALYGVTDGGWLTGSNSYGDLAKAQTFSISSSVMAEGMGVWIPAKIQTNGNPNSKVTFNIYPANGAGSASTGAVTTAPGNSIASVDVPIASIDTSIAGGGGFTWRNFSPVNVSNLFCAGVDLSTLAAGDSIGIMSTRDSVVTTPDYSWEKWSDASWHTLLQAWPINCDLYIFVIIDEGPIGIEEAASINGMRMVFRTGNVITDRIDLQFALDNAARTRLVISDLSGRTMLDEDLGQRAPGTHDRNIDASSWSAGTYLVSLISNGKTITKKVVKN